VEGARPPTREISSPIASPIRTRPVAATDGRRRAPVRGGGAHDEPRRVAGCPVTHRGRGTPASAAAYHPRPNARASGVSRSGVVIAASSERPRGAEAPVSPRRRSREPAGGIRLREAPAMPLGWGLRRSEAAALTLGRGDWREGRWCLVDAARLSCGRRVARGLRLARLQRHSLGRGHGVARRARGNDGEKTRTPSTRRASPIRTPAVAATDHGRLASRGGMRLMAYTAARRRASEVAAWRRCWT